MWSGWQLWLAATATQSLDNWLEMVSPLRTAWALAPNILKGAGLSFILWWWAGVGLFIAPKLSPHVLQFTPVNQRVATALNSCGRRISRTCCGRNPRTSWWSPEVWDAVRLKKESFQDWLACGTSEAADGFWQAKHAIPLIPEFNTWLYTFFCFFVNFLFNNDFFNFIFSDELCQLSWSHSCLHIFELNHL